MRAPLCHRLLLLATVATFTQGALYAVVPAQAQEEGPAAACAKGTDESNAALASAYMNAFAAADDRVFDEICPRTTNIISASVKMRRRPPGSSRRSPSGTRLSMVARLTSSRS